MNTVDIQYLEPHEIILLIESKKERNTITSDLSTWLEVYGIEETEKFDIKLLINRHIFKVANR